MRILAVLTVLTALPLPALAGAWAIDHAKTIITIDVAYRTGGKVTVRFPAFKGNVVFDPGRPHSTKAHIVVHARAARTGLVLLDAVVRGPEFLYARKYPSIDFNLTRLVQTGPSDADISGTITIRGVTRPLQLKARVYRFRPDEPDPAERIASFNVWGHIDRTEFGMTARTDRIETTVPIRILLSLRPQR
ncbi:MAG: YceI family protein [Paracoccaceae bacterium]